MDWVFADVTDAVGIGADERWSTGSSFADYDLDGDLDLYVANYLRYEFERGELSEGGTLRWPRRRGIWSGAARPWPITTTTATLDIFLVNTGQRALLWRNDTRAGHHLALMLEGRDEQPRWLRCTRVVVRVAGRTLVAEKRSAASYLSQNDGRMFFGTGVERGGRAGGDRVAVGHSPSVNGRARRTGVAGRRAGCERATRGG